MRLTNEQLGALEAKCLKFRQDLIDMLYKAQSGHPGGSLSLTEILTSIYYVEGTFSPDTLSENDHFVLCKGHGAPMLYIVLADKGFFPKEDLQHLRQIGSHLQGHPNALHTPGVDVSTGPLGLGYPVALGMALADRLNKRDQYTYAVLGDGELNEGVVWETALNVCKLNATKLITIVDNNHVQLDGTTDSIMPMGDIAAKFASFGYQVITCDGHSIAALCSAIACAKQSSLKPTVILAQTVKGKGVSFMEGQSAWHGKAIGDADYLAAKAELEVQK